MVSASKTESTLINMGPSVAKGYYRGPGSAPHNLYTSTDNIWFQTPPDQVWREGTQSWTMEIVLRTTKGETYRNTLTWK